MKLHDWIETRTDNKIRRYCFECGRLEEKLNNKWVKSNEDVEIVKIRVNGSRKN